MKNLEKYAPELYYALVQLLISFTDVLMDDTNDKAVRKLIKATNEGNRLIERIANEQAD